MELRLPLEMSPGRQATCRAVFGTWGSFPDDARAKQYRQGAERGHQAGGADAEQLRKALFKPGAPDDLLGRQLGRFRHAVQEVRRAAEQPNDAPQEGDALQGVPDGMVFPAQAQGDVLALLTDGKGGGAADLYAHALGHGRGVDVQVCVAGHGKHLPAELRTEN